MGTIAQAALLGAKDSITPLVVTLGSGFLNFLGDMFFVIFRNMGIGGAALATVIAEYAGGFDRPRLLVDRHE